jgi:hypothetical protein
MRFRKLRIAFSVTCGIACVLLIVLWVGLKTRTVGGELSQSPTDRLRTLWVRNPIGGRAWEPALQPDCALLARFLSRWVAQINPHQRTNGAVLVATTLVMVVLGLIVWLR